MYRIDTPARNIIVNLEPGIYILDDTSGIGKTYLCNLLKGYFDAGYTVRG